MKLYRMLLLMCLLSVSLIAFSQTSCELDPNCDPGFEEVPIDGGVLALLAGGIAFGYKAFKKRGNKENE